ncbi:BTAD domain-containing putative transcriptional regulator [Yinghuangia seranimata]|uniref:BTAD domain-containing putative transcriptional regulator n=1 Tax=Yinghuangia seranimata TaxID=408067 RepID=UPI00248B7B54|nr:BTAD domain-containing putative transcriptional regulator [Yinghuangia seranimata]MDI2131821.1 BTAD domain-containing putative transcriptional regulator [Yinghuangia seranimata]
MRFEVLGPLRVWTDDGRPVNVPEAKVRLLLADLLVHAGTPVSVDRLADDLWGGPGEAVPGNPGNTLQTKVSQLRRVFEQAEPGVGRGLVAYLPAGYQLRVADEAVDAGRFAALLGRARGTGDARARVALLTDALALWRGPAFAEFQDPGFARAAAARLEEQRLSAVEERAELRLGLGEHHLVADELADVVAAHPLRERLRAAHVTALYRAGRQADALASYEDLRERLADELGLDPGAELAALRQAILQQDVSLAPVAAPSTAEPSPTVGNLPAARGPLIGREADVERAAALLAEHRLVTLTGPGGVGKTRLALATAVRVADRFPDGTWLVELAAVRGGVAEAVAAALGVREEGGAVAAAAVDEGATGEGAAGGFTGPGERLDVAVTARAGGGVVGAGPGAVNEEAAGGSTGSEARLDVAGAADVDGGVAGAAIGTVEGHGQGASARSDVNGSRGTGFVGERVPVDPVAVRLAAVLRSRRLLLVLDNCEHVVDEAAALADRLLRHGADLRVLATSREPLALDGEAVSPVAPLAEAEAVRLFVARAEAAAPGFAPDAGERELVAGLCRRLDHLPLALELAAARVRVLGVRGLADRLDDRFRLLAAGRRDAPARQRTLRAVIDWSWEPLNGPERAVLRRLAVFANGATLEAVEAVCRASDEPAVDVLDVVARLVDRSLVTVVEGDAGVRYRLLESVAAYGLERLAEAGESDEVRDRHMAYAVTLAERADAHLYGHDQRTWLRTLDAEAADLRAALDRAVTRGAADEALRLVAAQSWYWLLRGRLTEARRALRLALAVPGGPTQAYADARARLAAFALFAGERELADEAVVDDGGGRWAGSTAASGLAHADRAAGGPVMPAQGEAGSRSAVADVRVAGERRPEDDAVTVSGDGWRDGTTAGGRGPEHLSAASRAGAEGGPGVPSEDRAETTWSPTDRGGLAHGGGATGGPVVPASRDGSGALPALGAGATARGTAGPAGGADVVEPAFASEVGDAATTPGDRAAWLLAFARSGFGSAAEVGGELARLIAAFEASGDRWGRAAALVTRATQAMYRGDLVGLRRDAADSAALFDALGDRWGRVRAGELLGVLAEIGGDYAEAARLLRAGLRGAEELDLPTDAAFHLGRLGRIALLTGDLAGADVFHERARAMAVEQSHETARQFAELGLALAARRRGDLEAAERWLLPWLAWNRRLEVAAGEALVLAELGFVAEQRRDLAAAEARHREGLAAARRTGDPRALALALEGLAGAAAAAGDGVRAAPLLGAAAALRESAGTPLPPAERVDVDRATAAARAVLGADGFAAYEAKGRRGAEAGPLSVIDVFLS